MATSYKNIVITPNISNTSDPKIVFSGGNTTVNTDITLNVYPASNGTLSFEGSAGQLFSITNDLSNSLFSVSDVSGIPSIEVFANGLVSLVPINGNVTVGNTSAVIVGNTIIRTTNAIFGGTIAANGGIGTAGQVLTSGAGGNAYWSTVTAVVNVAAQYAWTNTHSFSNTITFTGAVNAVSVDIGGGTDTTITRSSAGVLAVEGGIIPKQNRVNTFTANQVLSDGTLLVTGNTGTTSFITLENIGTVGRPQVYFVKARDFNASVVANDIVGQLGFFASDGTQNVFTASITAEIDGTPGTFDMPGRIEFATTPDGGSTPVEHVRITASGNVGIGNTAPNAKLAVTGTANVSGNLTIGSTSGILVGSLLVANSTVINATHLAGVATTGYARRGGGIGNIDYNAERTRASGFYSVDASPTNGPPSGAYSNYIQMTERGDTSAQIVVDYATGQLYSRGIQTATPTYSAWQTYLSTTANKTISGGFNVVSANVGSSSFTITPLSGNYQYFTNNGAATITAPGSDCAVDLLIINGATAGAITFSGFQVGATGGALTTTNGHDFIVSIRRINGLSTYSIYAMQ